MGTGLSRGARGHWRGGCSGGEERALCLEDGAMCLNVGERRAIDGPSSIDGIRTRLAALENYGSLSQERRDSRARSHISMRFVCSSAVTESVPQLYH